MKSSQPTDDLKQVFESINLPPVDVKQSVLQRINNRNGRRTYMFNKKRLIFGIVLAAFLLCAVGFAAMEIWELNGPGNTPFTYQTVTRDTQFSSAVVKEEYENLEPGNILAVLRVKDNPKKTISLLSKPLIVKSHDEITEKIGKTYKSPDNLPAAYSFKEAEIKYMIDESFRDEMIKESENTDKDYIYRILKPTDEVSTLNITYLNGDKQINIFSMYNYHGNDIYDGNGAKKVTKLNINGFDAIYAEYKGRHEIMWLEIANGANTYYSVGAPSATPKDDLLQIAESLK